MSQATAGQLVITYQDRTKRVINLPEEFFSEKDKKARSYEFISPMKKAFDIANSTGKPHRISLTRNNQPYDAYTYHVNAPSEFVPLTTLSDEKVLKKQLRAEWKNIPFIGKAIIGKLSDISSLAV